MEKNPLKWWDVFIVPALKCRRADPVSCFCAATSAWIQLAIVTGATRGWTARSVKRMLSTGGGHHKGASRRCLAPLPCSSRAVLCEVVTTSTAAILLCAAQCIRIQTSR